MKSKTKEALQGYLYILPSFILLLVFSVIPIFMCLYFSFTKYNILQAPEFLGLKNYFRLVQDPFVLASLKNTLLYTFVVVPSQTLLSIGIAAVIAACFRRRFMRYGGLLRSAMFIPVISSAILVGTLWSFLLSTDSGIINQILSFIRIPPINWLGTTQTALLSVCAVSIWKNVGYFMVIFYAGIMDIPGSLYEAAEVDGATKIQQFLFITVPGLKPIIYLVVTLGTIWSFQVFDIVYSMTGGGPGRSTVTLVLTIYNAAFKEYSMGYASSAAFLLFIIVILLSIAQKKIFAEKEERA